MIASKDAGGRGRGGRLQLFEGLGKAPHPAVVIVGGYFLLHVLRWLPDEIDVIPHGNLDSNDLGQAIGRKLSENFHTPITVTCPNDIPMKKGEISDCIAADGYNRRLVRLTQDDSKVHHHHELTEQEAPLVATPAPGFSP